MAVKNVNNVEVYASFTLSKDDLNTLNLLYLPLISSESLSLYLALSSLLERNNLKCEKISTQNICDILGISLTKFEKAKKVLEGIGLLETFTGEDKLVLILKAPLTPKVFLLDGTLGMYLYSKVGEDMYKYLVDHFRIAAIDKTGLTNITASFVDVFSSQMLDIDITPKYGFLLNRKNESGLDFAEHTFDYEVFAKNCNLDSVDKIYLEKFKKTIISTSYVYGFDENQMSRLYMESINHQGVFDFKLLKSKANSLFQFLHNEKAPKLSIKDDDSDLAKNIKQLENATAFQILSIADVPYENDYLKTLNEVYNTIELPRGVINCMILYLLRNYSSTGLPNLTYFKKTASSWIQQGIIAT